MIALAWPCNISYDCTCSTLTHFIWLDRGQVQAQSVDLLSSVTVESSWQLSQKVLKQYLCQLWLIATCCQAPGLMLRRRAQQNDGWWFISFDPWLQCIADWPILLSLVEIPACVFYVIFIHTDPISQIIATAMMRNWKPWLTWAWGLTWTSLTSRCDCVDPRHWKTFFHHHPNRFAVMLSGVNVNTSWVSFSCGVFLCILGIHLR